MEKDELSTRLRVAIARSGLTMKEVALQARISPAYLRILTRGARYENEAPPVQPSDAVLHKLEAALHAPGELTGQPVEPPRPTDWQFVVLLDDGGPKTMEWENFRLTVVPNPQRSIVRVENPTGTAEGTCVQVQARTLETDDFRPIAAGQLSNGTLTVIAPGNVPENGFRIMPV